MILRHRTRALALALSLLLPAGALSACGEEKADQSGRQDGSGKGSIRVWAHQGQLRENKALRDAVSSFNRSQGDVKVQLRLIPENDYPEVLESAKVADLPDVLEFDGPTMANLVHSEKLAPLESYISITTLANATDASRSQGTLDHELYGLGMFDSGLGLYGNRKLLDEAGVEYPQTVDDAWSADEFTVALKKLAGVDSDGEVLDIQEGNDLATEWGTYGFSPIVWSAGGELVSGNKASGSLDRPEVVQAFSTFQSWRPHVDRNRDGNALAKGRVALSWVGHWMYPAYRKALGDDLVVMPLPDFGKGPKTGQGSWAWGVGASTKNGKAAGKFLDFLMEDKNIKAMTEANGAPPATQTAMDASTLYRPGGPLQLFADQLASPCSETAIDQTCVAITRPATAGYPVVTSEFGKALKSIFGGSDPEAALSAAARAIDRSFKKHPEYEE